jgi:hypothetical protein
MAAIPSDLSELTRLEGELARRGARDAHLASDGSMAVSVVARSRADAVALVNDLLAKAVGAAFRR